MLSQKLIAAVGLAGALLMGVSGCALCSGPSVLSSFSIASAGLLSVERWLVSMLSPRAVFTVLTEDCCA